MTRHFDLNYRNIKVRDWSLTTIPTLFETDIEFLGKCNVQILISSIVISW